MPVSIYFNENKLDRTVSDLFYLSDEVPSSQDTYFTRSSQLTQEPIEEDIRFENTKPMNCLPAVKEFVRDCGIVPDDSQHRSSRYLCECFNSYTEFKKIKIVTLELDPFSKLFKQLKEFQKGVCNGEKGFRCRIRKLPPINSNQPKSTAST